MEDDTQVLALVCRAARAGRRSVSSAGESMQAESFTRDRAAELDLPLTNVMFSGIDGRRLAERLTL